jgi:integrase
MSAGGEEYIDSYDPDGNVLRFWFEKWHCEATTDDTRSTQRTQKSTRDSLDRFKRFRAAQSGEFDCHWTDIDLEQTTEDSITPPREVTPQIAEDFLVAVVEHYAPSTQQTTFGDLKQAYEWCEDNVESVEINPFEKVYKKHKERNGSWFLETPSGRDPHIISLDEARSVVRTWGHPLWLTIQLFLAKVPRRRGAISNLDFEDISLDRPGCDWTVHPELRQWDDHIIFRSDKRESDPGRNTGNKTKTNTRVPLDDELRDTLIWYLSSRPQPESPSDPLFLSLSGGTRLSGTAISNRYCKKGKELNDRDDVAVTGFYGPGDDDNLNVHYWRHWGTTWYEDQFGGDPDSFGNTAMTDYLRGDSRNEIKGLYNGYSTDKRDMILNAMPTFLEPYTDD